MKQNGEKLRRIALTQLGIPRLTYWVEKQIGKQRKLAESEIFREWAKKNSSIKSEKELTAIISQIIGLHEEMQSRRPTTVGELLDTFVAKGQIEGLAQGTMKKVLKRVAELGPIGEIWPSLTPKKAAVEGLTALSKGRILKSPIVPLFRHSVDSNWLDIYMGCKKSELDTKTIRDLIAIDPLEERCHRRKREFFRRRKRAFIGLQQALREVGFTEKDGPFFNWIPETKSLERARKILTNDDLEPKELEKFCKLLVRRRLVV